MGQSHRIIGETNQLPADLTVEKLTHWANVYLEKNDFVQAHPYISRLADYEKVCSQAIVTIGLLTLMFNRRNEVARCFRRDRDKAPDDFEVNFGKARVNTIEFMLYL